MSPSTYNKLMLATGVLLAAAALSVLLWPAARHGSGGFVLIVLMVLRFVLEYRFRRGSDNPFHMSMPALVRRAKEGKLGHVNLWEDALTLLMLGALIMMSVDPG